MLNHLACRVLLTCFFLRGVLTRRASAFLYHNGT